MVAEPPAAAPTWVGLRTGLSARHLRQMFYQTEALAAWQLPWALGEPTGWHLETGMEFSAGWLTTGAKHGGVGTIGMGIELSQVDLPLRLTAGAGMTWLTRHDFEKKDFGIPLQFTSYLGIAMDLNSQFRLGYRFQHMSNAGLRRPNPGLDLHAFTLSCRY
jgi:lipid A 3-O-deacylase